MDERKKCVHHARRVSPGDGAAAVHHVGHARDGDASDPRIYRRTKGPPWRLARTLPVAASERSPARDRSDLRRSSPFFAQTDPMRVSRCPSRVGGRSVGQRSPAVARQRSG